MPLIGHSWLLLRRPLAFLESLRTMGRIVRVDMGKMPVYMLTKPELVHTILVTQARGVERIGTLFDRVREGTESGLSETLISPCRERHAGRVHAGVFSLRVRRDLAACEGTGRACVPESLARSGPGRHDAEGLLGGCRRRGGQRSGCSPRSPMLKALWSASAESPTTPESKPK